MWFILNKQYTVVGVLDNGLPQGIPFFNDVHRSQLLNGYDQLSFDVVSNHKVASLLEIEGFVIYTNNRDGFELFRIKEITEAHGDSMIKSIHCETAATSDLTSKRIRPTTFTSANIEEVIETLLATTGWELGEVDYAGIISAEITDYPTALEAINDLIAQFGSEIEFKVEFNGTQIVRKIVNLYQQRGKKTNIIFEYGKNLQGVRRIEKSSAPLYTAMIGVGKDEDGVRLTFAELDVTPPAPFVKVGDYVADMDALEHWGLNGQHIYGVYTNTSAQSSTELYEGALTELKKYNKPQLTYEVDVVMLEQVTGYSHTKVNVGDTIMVKDRTFTPELYLNARVLSKESSETDKEKGQVVLGEYILLNVQPIVQIQKIQRKIDLREEEWNRALKEAEEAKRKAEEIEDNVVYKVEVASTKGNIFRNGDINTALVARVYKGKDDITDLLLASAFVWKKFDKDGIEDIAWFNANRGVGKSVIVSNAQVQERAVFNLDVDTTLLK